MGIRITQAPSEVLRDGSPNARITQAPSEVLRDGAPNARIAQVPAEVLRDGAPNLRATQAILEVLRSTRVGDPTLNPQAVTDAITVTPRIGGDNRQVVSSTVTVSPALPRILMTQEVAEVLRSGPPALRATQAVLEVLRTSHYSDEIFNIAVGDAILVTPAIVRKGPNHQSVADAMAVSPATAARDTVVRLAVGTTIVVSPAPATRNTHVPITVVDTIAVTIPSSPRATVVRLSVGDAIGIAPACAARNTNVRIGVTTTMGVGTPNSEQTNRISVADTASVSALPSPIPGHYGHAVGDAISLFSVFTASTNPLLMPVGDRISLADGFVGGGSRRQVTVVDAISIGQSPDPKRPVVGLTDFVLVATQLAGGPDHRVLTVRDTIEVAAATGGAGTGDSQSLADRVGVTTGLVGKGPIVPLVVRSSLTVSSNRRVAGPRRVAVADSLFVSSIVAAPAVTVNRQSVSSSLSVADRFRANLVDARVSDAIATSMRLATFEIGVTSRIHATPALRRDFDAQIVDSLAFAEPLAATMIRHATFVDAMPVGDITTRAVIWARPITDLLAIPDPTYQKRIFLPDPITVPVVSGGLVTNYCTLQSKSAAITLPRPLLGDGLDNVDALLIQRSMNGRSMALTTSSTRRKLRYTFRLDKAKAIELRAFVEANLSEVITLTTHDAQIWVVQIPRSPFEIQYAGRSSRAKEFATVELGLEGEKISG